MGDAALVDHGGPSAGWRERASKALPAGHMQRLRPDNCDHRDQSGSRLRDSLVARLGLRSIEVARRLDASTGAQAGSFCAAKRP